MAALGDVGVPEGATVMDMQGKTIIPGLVDVHGHMHFSSGDIHPETEWRYHTNLDFGVTTQSIPFDQGVVRESWPDLLVNGRHQVLVPNGRRGWKFDYVFLRHRSEKKRRGGARPANVHTRACMRRVRGSPIS